MGDRGQLAVKRRDADAYLIPSRQHLPPYMGSAGVETEYASFHALAEGAQPGLQRRFPLSCRESVNSPAELTNGDGAQVKFRFVGAEPCHHFRIRLRFCELAENIGIDKIAHRLIAGVESLPRGRTSNG